MSALWRALACGRSLLESERPLLAPVRRLPGRPCRMDKAPTNHVPACWAKGRLAPRTPDGPARLST
eukprot:223687-Alexandrium_andersonii.AAC.1